ncbi:uncharacterized protein H6S33_009878 [Morchella sextelata]|uniref:uncharacterized protein n=1 Tax=Morchella sextelata TaxID=1174677 RepID=UPI001D0560ED|nr:uncharacterized protein H6S33_009878 [Morchella sextelata]KAH0602268.1 hypothetical protein H6S33_009878 [Morchella sextelata]
MSGMGELEYEQEKFERSNGSILCRKQLLLSRGKLPLIHISSGVQLPSGVLREAQVAESRPTLSQMPRAASGADNDSISRQHVSKQQRDAAMAALPKVGVDNRSTGKANM